MMWCNLDLRIAALGPKPLHDNTIQYIQPLYYITVILCYVICMSYMRLIVYVSWGAAPSTRTLKARRQRSRGAATP